MAKTSPLISIIGLLFLRDFKLFYANNGFLRVYYPSHCLKKSFLLLLFFFLFKNF
jgi:hypothetical protein